MKRVIVPEGMVKAAVDAAFYPGRLHTYGDDRQIWRIVEAVLLWQSENPWKPTNEDILQIATELGHRFNWIPHVKDVIPHVKDVVIEWQKRMFLAPEPEKAPDSAQMEREAAIRREARKRAFDEITALATDSPLDDFIGSDAMRVFYTTLQRRAAKIRKACKHPLNARIVNDDNISGHYEICGTCMKTFR
jgi:hypothetical protein